MWGIDRLSAGELGNTRRRLRNSAVALLSQASAVDRRGKPVLDVLEELGVRPVRIFAGEHGFDGVAQAEEAVESIIPPRRELEISRPGIVYAPPTPMADASATLPSEAEATLDARLLFGADPHEETLPSRVFPPAEPLGDPRTDPSIIGFG